MNDVLVVPLSFWLLLGEYFGCREGEAVTSWTDLVPFWVRHKKWRKTQLQFNNIEGSVRKAGDYGRPKRNFEASIDIDILIAPVP